MIHSMFEPLTFRHGPTMRNRAMLAPLTNQQSHSDGTLSDEEIHFLTMRGRGGFGLTMTAAAHVQQVGQGFPGQLGVFDDRHLPGLTRLARELNATGTVSYVQLHHAGMRSPADLIGGVPVSASDDPATGARALTTAEVEMVIEDFVGAARRVEQAGFHGVELHGAHGYLICQFLASETNRRTDRYGGTLENRSRMLFEIIDRIRAECGEGLALAVRLSPERFGMVLSEAREIYSALVDSGKVDMIDMSLWDVFKTPVETGYEGATLLEQFTSLPRGDVRLAVAGKLVTPAHIGAVLDRGVDVAVLGRMAIIHHDYVQRLADDPAFTPATLPVPRAHLAAEGVSAVFIDYLASSFRMVAD